jgi:hypothetical protein
MSLCLVFPMGWSAPEDRESASCLCVPSIVHIQENVQLIRAQVNDTVYRIQYWMFVYLAQSLNALGTCGQTLTWQSHPRPCTCSGQAKGLW